MLYPVAPSPVSASRRVARCWCLLLLHRYLSATISTTIHLRHVIVGSVAAFFGLVQRDDKLLALYQREVGLIKVALGIAGRWALLHTKPQSGKTLLFCGSRQYC